MQALDSAALLSLNRWVGTSWTFDYLLLTVLESSLLKGGVLVALLWWLWERDASDRSPLLVARTLAGTLVAVALARGMQNFLPMRPRPLHDAALAGRGFRLAEDIPATILEGWSSFPSDHAVLAFAMATAVFLAHRGLGAFALFWALVVNGLPRVYFGLHYPSDILGGAAIGIAVMALVHGLRVSGGVERAVRRFATERRGLYYAVLFLVTNQMATVFEGARDLAEAGATVAKLMLQRL
ncbi:phosphatase PAP2 family protein [Roseomonas nepalensis]|uniref:Phosphatase PAP2 family protein n=1 Tax=Muricoccus nepalensis TaxID=1854500 RepID=A0A502FGN8_9PROT|nr:phosphatase PAP2 family protein [Roseomonas nepalensis]TPG48392.1 phosphatase PAP2 family protein [Roseomonas nepalensis]